MASEPESLPYLIIGGGLAGLALAQCLKQASLPFHVFEKDDHAFSRAQGHRMRISPEGVIALQSLLPAELFSLFENTCCRLQQGGHQLNALTGREIPWPASIPQRKQGGDTGDTPKGYNVDRAVLRRILLQGLNGHITFGKAFERYKLDECGATAIFRDGSVARGRMIIGADGVGSSVRKQMLPNFKILDTEGRAIFGKTPITAHISSRVPDHVSKCVCIIGDPDAKEGSMKLCCDIMRFDHEQESMFDLPVDYIYWVLVFRRENAGMSDRDLLSLTNHGSAAKASELTKEWHGSIRAIIEGQDPSETSALAFLIADPESAAWTPDTRVTVVGDAAHPCAPIGGVGANGAFVDVASLSRVLRNDLSANALGKHEEEMRIRAKALVARSAANSGNFYGMRPIEELEPVRIWDCENTDCSNEDRDVLDMTLSSPIADVRQSTILVGS